MPPAGVDGPLCEFGRAEGVVPLAVAGSFVLGLLRASETTEGVEYRLSETLTLDGVGVPLQGGNLRL